MTALAGMIWLASFQKFGNTWFLEFSEKSCRRRGWTGRDVRKRRDATCGYNRARMKGQYSTLMT
jgi:ribosomal protein L37E